MKVDLRTTYDADVDAVAAAYADPELYASLDDLPKLGGPEVVDHEVDGGLVRLAVRWRFTGDLSSAVTSVIDRTKLTWVEHSQHDLTNHEVRWRLEPDHYADRLRASGHYRFAANDGESAIRHTTGTLEVRFPLVGGRVESAIVSGLDEHLAAEAPIVADWIADRT